MKSHRAQRTGPEVAGSCFRFPAEVDVLECHAKCKPLVASTHMHSFLSGFVLTAGVSAQAPLRDAVVLTGAELWCWPAK